MTQVLAYDVQAKLMAAAKMVGNRVPASFVGFARTLGIVLSPAQRVIATVAYDGRDPADLPPADLAVARLLFGPVDRLSRAARKTVVNICGARAGKTYILGALRMLHLALTVSLEGLAPGEVASAPIIAPDTDLAAQALTYVKGALSHPQLAASVVAERAHSVEIERDGRIVEIVVRAASARGRTGRGRSLVGALLDEAGFFYDESYQVNDEEVFRGIKPRILPGGQAIVQTTPWAQTGLAHDLFAANHGDPSVAGLACGPVCAGTAVAVHAPTLLLRDTPELREMVATETARDPENAEREYGARFMATSSATFFDPAAVAGAIRADLALPTRPSPGDRVSAGADYAFARNSSALVVVHRTPAGRYRVSEVLERRPEPGAPLKPSTIVTEFSAAVDLHRGTYTMADGHYRETVDEFMPSHQSFVDAPKDVSAPFVRARALMREGLVDVPNHARLLRQLREVKSRPASGGRVQIILPQWRTGEHGDLVAAMVLALYHASSGELVPEPQPSPGTTEHDREQRRRRMEARYSRPRWMGGR